MDRTLHQYTPLLIASDSRGLTVRHIAYHRAQLDDPPQARISRQQHDARGEIIAAWDPRLHAAGAAPNQTAIFSLSGATLLAGNVDSGTRINRHADSGAITESWDGRGTHWRTDYDVMSRPLQMSEQAQDQPARVITRFTYVAPSPEAALHNRCARVSRLDDTAGSLLYADYALLGETLSETRHFLSDPERPDWPQVPAERDLLLEPGPGTTTQWRFTATGEAQLQIDAMGNRQRFVHGLSGALSEATLRAANGAEHAILSDVAYNANGEIQQQTAGNGVISRCEFDLLDGRLKTLQTVKPDGHCVQKLSYEYDPVGNIVRIEDAALSTSHYANQRIDPVNHYTYDSLSQLIGATGREALGAAIGPQLPDLELNPGDTSRLLNFTQRYQYDSAGNLTRLQHVGHNNYTRSKFVAPDSNRCLPANPDGVPPDFDSAFDISGNLLTLQSGQRLEWDGFNQLSRTVSLARQDGADDDERYVYDADGMRVRKMVTAKANSTTNVAEVRYLPGLEIRHNGHEQLHVITMQAGLCGVRHLHWVAGKPSDIDNDQQRYSFDDPMGSSAMELDQTARLISHEGYYPYGGSAWWAARSVIEARYKIARYSGKERDASGLYYFGQRYYAPWLQQWISPDPGGTLDGLNLYRMVGNNPVTYGDPEGTDGLRKSLQLAVKGQKRFDHDRAEHAKAKARDEAKVARQQQIQPLKDAVKVHREVLSIARKNAATASQQLLNHSSPGEQAISTVKRAVALVATKAIPAAAGAGGAVLGSFVAPGPGTVAGAAIAAKAASVATGYAISGLGWNDSVKLKTSALSGASIYEAGDLKAASLQDKAVSRMKKLVPSSKKDLLALGKDVAKEGLGKASSTYGPALQLIPEIPELIHENIGAAGGLSPDKLQKLDDNVGDLIERITDGMGSISSLFGELKVDSVSHPEIGNVYSRSTAQTLANETAGVLGQLKELRNQGQRLVQGR